QATHRTDQASIVSCIIGKSNRAFDVLPAAPKLCAAALRTDEVQASVRACSHAVADRERRLLRKPWKSEVDEVARLGNDSLQPERTREVPDAVTIRALKAGVAERQYRRQLAAVLRSREIGRRRVVDAAASERASAVFRRIDPNNERARKHGRMVRRECDRPK